MDIYSASVQISELEIPFDNLDHGTKVLCNKEECNRYLALYGGHHFHKLYAAYRSIKFRNIEGRNIEIVDWGCGQALATIILIDYLIENNIHLNIKSITLIEPSTVAIERGRKIARNLLQNYTSMNSGIHLVNKYLDEVEPADLKSQPDTSKIHLFSNILDVEGFDLHQLHQLIVTSFDGVNHVVATSPNNGSKDRLDTFYDLFLESHQVAKSFSSSDDVWGEIFYVGRGLKNHKISRYERQFTLILN